MIDFNCLPVLLIPQFYSMSLASCVFHSLRRSTPPTPRIVSKHSPCGTRSWSSTPRYTPLGSSHSKTKKSTKMSNADTGKTVPVPRHPDFKTVEASRPSWREDASPSYTKTRKPDWKPGEGATDGGENLKKSHVEIDPYAEGRPSTFNYKLLISAIVPRPIGFVSTTSADGK